MEILVEAKAITMATMVVVSFMVDVDQILRSTMFMERDYSKKLLVHCGIQSVLISHRLQSTYPFWPDLGKFRKRKRSPNHSNTEFDMQ